MDDFRTRYPWLTNEFFEKILRTDRKNNNISVSDFTIKAALGKGENYASQMLRAKVHFSDGIIKQTVSFVIKSSLQNDLGDLVAELGIFGKEIDNYVKVIPAVEALLRSIGDATVFSAK